MPYIKLLTVLAGLALLTACGGGTGLTATNDTITAECMTNPFGADCNKFAEALLLRESRCLADTTADPSCLGETGIATLFCTARPDNDSAGCVAVRCASIPACADGVITYADWLEIVSPDATPNTTTRRNQFLQGDATTGLNAGVGYRVNSGQPQPTAFIVDFENGSSRFLLTGIAGGQAADGFAIFRGTIGDVRHFYASILPTTNLGAPITTATGTADWPGRGVIDFGGLDSAFEDFVLTVDFGKSEVSSPASANGSLSLKGTWDERGVITGTTLNAEYLDDARTMVDVGNPLNTPGILTGLIGQDGAVGVFHSNNDGIGQGYSGGFIAAPPPPPDPCIAADNCVEFAAWEASLDTGGVNASQTLQESGYRNTGTNNSTYIKLDGDKIKFVSVATSPPHAATDRTFTPNILRLNETEGQDGYESGFAYVWNNLDFNGQIYAGILATTNLGAPLVDDSKDGTWTGRLGGTTSFAEPTLVADTFSLQVTFGGSSSEPGSVGTIESLDGDGVVGFAPVAGLRDGMRFRGDFNAAGVMWGKVNSNDAAGADNGTFSGLIGAKGAVGVFRNATSVSNYVGGFEVKPPAPSSP